MLRHFIPDSAVLSLCLLVGSAQAEERGDLPRVLPKVAPSETTPVSWDTLSDTWVATDALGRSVPDPAEVGPPRQDRFVAMFYFLWLGAHVRGGPYDVGEILREDPDALSKKDSPLWGPLGAMHHWGESIFGYYVSEDPFVLRKHAQMLSDAGVDAVIFDVTNQFTYRKQYTALLRAFSEVRSAGGRTPQVAFLCPFWEPAKVVAELYRDLYEPGLHPELWFRWDGRPLILADPERLDPTLEWGAHDTPVRLERGHTLGQSFSVKDSFVAVGGCFPTWGTKGAAVTLTLHAGGPQGERIASGRFRDIDDNAWLEVRLETPAPPGSYYLEALDPDGTVGWWSRSTDDIPGGNAHVDGVSVAGDRTLRVRLSRSLTASIRELFTFRSPQPDYFRGPTGPDMWSWLEIYPQHVFPSSRGHKEQMSVGVAQNAVGRRLGSMSEPGARGRSFHDGATSTEPDAVRLGLNFAEQFEHALREDPELIFVTGWNEWIASRFEEFNGVQLPVMFVDQFDQEHSRDIEPMKGGHGDDYYYQLVSFVRRFKGSRSSPEASPPRTIRLDDGFDQWTDVRPEYRDDREDTIHRDHPGYNDCVRYVDRTGRNDIVAAKVTHDEEYVYFYARTRAPITRPEGAEWMVLLIDIDESRSTGWEGYDIAVNRLRDGGRSTVERSLGENRWERLGYAELRADDRELHLACPRVWLEPRGKGRATPRLDFKWVDNVPGCVDPIGFELHGDAAPNGRFLYRYIGTPVR